VPLNKNLKLEKSSEQTAAVKEQGGTEYPLFASRVANGSFSAQVVFLDGINNARETAARNLTNAVMPQIKIQSLKIPALTTTADFDRVSGVYKVPGIIPGDPVIIIIEDDEWSGINPELRPEDEQDMGNIHLTKGVNLKASIRAADPGDNIALLYADGSVQNFMLFFNGKYH